jgi:hypothetical protein
MPQRLSADEVRERMEDNDTMLVCAYDDSEKCRRIGIEEAVPYPDFKSKLGSIPKSKEIVFFCA